MISGKTGRRGFFGVAQPAQVGGKVVLHCLSFLYLPAGCLSVLGWGILMCYYMSRYHAFSLPTPRESMYIPTASMESACWLM